VFRAVTEQVYDIYPFFIETDAYVFEPMALAGIPFHAHDEQGMSLLVHLLEPLDTLLGGRAKLASKPVSSPEVPGAEEPLEVIPVEVLISSSVRNGPNVNRKLDALLVYGVLYLCNGPPAIT
jgi:hypothetical protein